MLLKRSSRRRRTKAQILADKQREIDRLKAEKAQLVENQKLKDQLQLAQSKVEQSQEASQIISNLIQGGAARIDH